MKISVTKSVLYCSREMRLSLCFWVIFDAFCRLLIFFSKWTLLKNYFRNTIRMSKNLDPDKARRFVGPGLGSNRLQRLSEDGTSRQRVMGLPTYNVNKVTCVTKPSEKILICKCKRHKKRDTHYWWQCGLLTRRHKSNVIYTYSYYAHANITIHMIG